MILFFVRHFNDIDHITPIAWKLLKKNDPVAVYCMNARYDFWDDYRIRFLRQEGAEVNELAREFENIHGRGCKWMHTLMERCFRVEKAMQKRSAQHPRKITRWSAMLAGVLGTLCYAIARRLYYRVNWARKILLHKGARAICFDHIMPTHYVVGTFLSAAETLGVPSLSLPHGVLLYTNEATKEKSGAQRRQLKFSRYDHIIAPNNLRKIVLMGSGVPADKIAVLGSARYCPEWMVQNWKILPKVIPESAQASDELKLVFFPSKPQCNVDLERLAATLEMLAAIEGIRVLVKPHTRAAGDVELPVNARLKDAAHVLTAELCQWADVVLVVGSSVVTEGLVRGKPSLYLKYLHSNTTLVEELRACWTIRSEDDLQSAISTLRTNKRDVPYRKEDVERYLVAVVQGDRDDKDVLGRYRDFILAATGSKRRTGLIEERR
jgi:hypothetical protein